MLDVFGWVAGAVFMLVYILAAGVVLLVLALAKSLEWTPALSVSPPRAAVVLFSYYSEDPRPRREAEALLRAGFEVDILCLRRVASEPIQECVGGANVYRVLLKRRRNGRMTYAFQYSAFLLASFAFLTVRCFKAYRIVHVHNMPDVLVFSAIMPRLLGAKVILDLHDPVPEVFRVIYNLRQESRMVRVLQLLESWSIRFAHLVLTPNKAFKELFVSRGCPAEKIRIVMNSPDEAIFVVDVDRDRAEKLGFNLMFHGSLLERSGLSLAVDALAILHRRMPGLKLHIHGEPNQYIKTVMEKVGKLQLRSCVDYHGYTPQREIPFAISTADLGIIPNPPNPFNEINFPTRIFEFLAMHKVVVAPRTKGILDYFEEDELLLFTPGDAEDLAHKIEWACLHPAQAQEVLRRGRKVYEAHRWAKEQKVLMTLVNDLLGAPPVEGAYAGAGVPGKSDLMRQRQAGRQAAVLSVSAQSRETRLSDPMRSPAA